jgi:glycosyltransferase involved in cell wall biosynthesis
MSWSASLWYSVADPLRLKRERSVQKTSFPGRVSVPIATFDRIDILLERTIPAILSQTHQNVEVIVVGDGTPLTLWKKLEALREERVHIFRLPKRTRYPDDPLSLWMVAGWKARNFGAQVATGEWILWMSDDDILPPASIEALLEVVQQYPEVEVVSGTKQAGTVTPRFITMENAGHGLPYPVVGMPLLCHSTLRSFRWNSQSWRKDWNRPCDLDLLDRMGRSGIRMATTRRLVAIHPEVAGTGAVGSRGSVEEELRRRAREFGA